MSLFLHRKVLKLNFKNLNKGYIRGLNLKYNPRILNLFVSFQIYIYIKTEPKMYSNSSIENGWTDLAQLIYISAHLYGGSKVP